MVLTVSFALSLVTGLIATIAPAKLASQELDASVGASGPRDFAVRFSIVRPRVKRATTLPRPPHPVPNVRDDRETPLSWGAGWKTYADDLGRKGSEEFLRVGLDRPNQLA